MTGKVWVIEAYNSYPNIRFQFTVVAASLEEARLKAEQALGQIRIIGTWSK